MRSVWCGAEVVHVEWVCTGGGATSVLGGPAEGAPTVVCQLGVGLPQTVGDNHAHRRIYSGTGQACVCVCVCVYVLCVCVSVCLSVFYHYNEYNTTIEHTCCNSGLQTYTNMHVQFIHT